MYTEYQEILSKRKKKVHLSFYITGNSLSFILC